MEGSETESHSGSVHGSEASQHEAEEDQEEDIDIQVISGAPTQLNEPTPPPAEKRRRKKTIIKQFKTNKNDYREKKWCLKIENDTPFLVLGFHENSEGRVEINTIAGYTSGKAGGILIINKQYLVSRVNFRPNVDDERYYQDEGVTNIAEYNTGDVLGTFLN